MRISVAIITRNRSQQLKRCLLSLTKQTIKPYEVLVVDNGSADSTKEVILSYKNKLPIRYVFEKTAGIPNAKKRVLKEIKGDIFASIDDDCEAFPDWIERIREAHTKYPQAGVVQGWFFTLPKNDPINTIIQYNDQTRFGENTIDSQERRASLKKNSRILLINAKNASYKMTLFKKHKLQFVKQLKHGEDFAFAKQVLSISKDIIFYPSVKVNAWEHLTLFRFLKQQFRSGREAMYVYLRWPKIYFPARNSMWGINRIYRFILLCIQTRPLTEFPKLFIIFVLERVAVFTGRYLELLIYKKAKF